MIDKSKNYYRFIELYHNFVGSEEYAFYQSLLENRSAISILKANFRQLKRTVQFHNDHAIREAPDSRKHLKILWRTQRELARLISNYLSSVCSQISYGRIARSVIKKNHIVLSLFLDQLRLRFEENRQHRFIVEFRNYVSHESNIKVISEFGMRIEWDAPRSNFYIDKQRLLKSSNWKQPAKEYLQRIGDKVYIYDILQEHFLDFVSFQNEIYLSLFIADAPRAKSLVKKLEETFNSCKEIGYQNFLPFNESYLRYLHVVLGASQSTIRYWQNRAASQ